MIFLFLSNQDIRLNGLDLEGLIRLVRILARISFSKKTAKALHYQEYTVSGKRNCEIEYSTRNQWFCSMTNSAFFLLVASFSRSCQYSKNLKTIWNKFACKRNLEKIKGHNITFVKINV